MDPELAMTFLQALGFPAFCLMAILWGLYKLGLKILTMFEPHLQRIVDRHMRFIDNLEHRLSTIDDIHVIVSERRTDGEIHTITRPPKSET